VAGGRAGLVAACILAVAGLFAAAAAADAPGRYLDTGAFLDTAFGKRRPEAQVLWLPGEVRESLAVLLGHPFDGLRIRYWQAGDRTAWILDEIGKELPITIGVSVNSCRIDLLRILEFREVRGWEVRYPFFTEQFHGATLTDKRDLSASIDGITGATLSVGAVKGVAKAAVYLHEYVNEK
jgi:hypothetical protein